VIVIDRAKHPHVDREGARQFATFLTSPEGREAIAKFGVQEFGQPLSFPASEN